MSVLSVPVSLSRGEFLRGSLRLISSISSNEQNSEAVRQTQHNPGYSQQGI